MQNAKDTFYISMSRSLATLNPERTVFVRGANRPAVVVAENELEQELTPLLDTFVLQWSSPTVDVTEPLGLHAEVCHITFTTRGTPELSSMDRGRVLETLSYELRAILLPAATPKRDFTGDVEVTKATNVFWTEPVLGSIKESKGTLTQVATVHVFALGEAGEA